MPAVNTRAPTPEPELPPRPERPDCCGGGCATCVLDGYAEEVERWQQQVDALQRAHATTPPAPT